MYFHSNFRFDNFTTKYFFVKADFKQQSDKIEDFIALTLRSLRLCVKKYNCRRQLKSQSENC